MSVASSNLSWVIAHSLVVMDVLPLVMVKVEVESVWRSPSFETGVSAAATAFASNKLMLKSTQNGSRVVNDVMLVLKPSILELFFSAEISLR